MASRLYERYGPWALVTGASSGLGEEFAKQLAEHGFNVVLAARRLERLQKLALDLESQYGVQTKVVEVDFAHPRFMDRLDPVLSETDIGLAILNAGFSVTGEFLSVEMEQHERLWRVNCHAPLQLSHALGRQMVGRGRGGIIIVSSSVAFSPIPYWTHYAATKAYSLFLGEGLAYELKDKGIDVLALCPGGMRTEFQSVAGIKPTGAMPVAPVAQRALRQLGKRSMLIPGLHMRMMFYRLPKIVPRNLWIRIMGKLMNNLRT